MLVKVLIVEEVDEGKPGSFNSYVMCSQLLGYEYYICHEYEQIPQILKTFDPSIVFFITDSFTRRAINYIDVMRQTNKNLKIILASNRSYDHRTKGSEDFYLTSTLIGLDEFQQIISELLLTNLYDDSSLVKEIKLDLIDDLSDNALRAIAAEQMWPSKKARLEDLIESENKGEQFDEKTQQDFDWLIQTQEFLMQRKAKAAEILIARGCEETAEQLMNPKDE